MKISTETFNFFKAFRHMTGAELYLNSIIRDGKVVGQTKNMVAMLKNRIDVNIRELRQLLHGADLEMIDRDMLSPEVALQMDNILDLLAALPQSERDEVEEFAKMLTEKLTEQ